MHTAATDAQALIARALKLSVASVPLDGNMETVPGWDSLNHFNVISEVENEIERQLSSDEIVSLRSIQDVEKILSAHSKKLKTKED